MLIRRMCLIEADDFVCGSEFINYVIVIVMDMDIFNMNMNMGLRQYILIYIFTLSNT